MFNVMMSDFDRALRQLGQLSSFSRFDEPMPLDVFRRGQELHARFDSPGVDVSDVTVTVEDGELVVSAERRFAPDPTDEVFVTSSRFGRAKRRIRLPRTAVVDEVNACIENGVLCVIVPLAAAPSTSRTVKVDVADRPSNASDGV